MSDTALDPVDAVDDETDDRDEDVKGTEERATDLSKRAGVAKQLEELFAEVEQGFADQSERSDDLVDYWDVYNCKLTGHQFYDGNSKIFVPIVHNAVDARKTRFTNQIFPTNGRNVDVTSSDGEMPYATMSLLEYYVNRAQMRTKIMPALVRNGD